MKSVIYEFDPVIYPFPLMVCKYIPGVTASEIAGKYNKVLDRRSIGCFDEEELTATPTLTARTLCVVDKESEEMKYLVVLYRPKKTSWGIVAHEALHIVTMICDWLGISPPDQYNDEPHAYLIQWVANCIGSVLQGHPEKMKGVKVE